MIKLFRNIRKNLIAQGKTANYIKYAVGVIVLEDIGTFNLIKIDHVLPSLEGIKGWAKP